MVASPGTKGGAFCPRWSHHPGQNDLLSRVVASPGTKGVFRRAGKIPSPRPTFSPGWIYHLGQKGPVFPRFPPNLMFVFVSFYFSFKIGFHLLIQLIKLWFQKLWNKIFYLYINLIHATKIINFHSSDWVNEISNFFEIIFVILTMQKYIRWTNFFKLLLFDRKWILSWY